MFWWLRYTMITCNRKPLPALPRLHAQKPGDGGEARLYTGTPAHFSFKNSFKKKNPMPFSWHQAFSSHFRSSPLTLLFIGGQFLDFKELIFIVFNTTRKDCFWKEP